MSELLTSPLFWAAAWFSCGASKLAIDFARKSQNDFYSVCHSLVFGPIALVTELLEVYATRRPETIETKEANVEAVDSAIEATRRLGEAIELAADSIESLENADEKERGEKTHSVLG